MKYAGMTCATGAAAFSTLVANEDSFVAEKLRAAGAVCIGRTNTPPMMASGMHRGVHGRAESPYNLDYLTAAFSSGSSNGSGTSTAASFAAFGLGSETVSSGRSPASNNALVAYTPSRTVISLRGCWPLYPTCDVLVPHTRTVQDMLTILDVLTQVDERKDGDFWREQTLVTIPDVPKPTSFLSLSQAGAEPLRGKTLAVPRRYIGGSEPRAKPAVVSKGVIKLWERAKEDLERLGAKVIETDFSLVTNYEDDSVSGQANNVVGCKPHWNYTERHELVAWPWDDFLKANGDANCPDLASVDGTQIFPRPPGYIPDKYAEHTNFLDYSDIVELARQRNGRSIWDLDGLAEALPALETQRKRDLEDWMDAHGIDAVVFPANGDVGRADVDTNETSAQYALQYGVKYSNGNRALRHLGVPTVSVSMGVLEESRMPVNLTFAGKHGQDTQLLGFAYAYEQSTHRRVAPPVTPALVSDSIALGEAAASPVSRGSGISIDIKKAANVGENKISVSGVVEGIKPDDLTLEVQVDGKPISLDKIKVDKLTWSFESSYMPYEPSKPLYGGVGEVVGNVVVVILARAPGSVGGKMILIDQNL